MTEIDLEAASSGGHLPRGLRRALAILVGATALIAAALAWIEAEAGSEEDGALVDAARGAVEIFVGLTAGESRAQFEQNATRQALFVDYDADAELVGTSEGDLGVAKQSATSRAAERLSGIAGAMSQPLGDEASLADATREALSEDLFRLEPALAAQNAAVERANEYGSRQSAATFALGLTAIAGALLGLAGLIRTQAAGRLLLGTAGAALTVAVVWTAVPFLF